MNAFPSVARGLGLVAFAAVAVATAGCRTSCNPCRPPCDMAERPPVGCPPPAAACPAPRPAPCAPPVAARPPAPPPAPVPLAPPVGTAKVDSMKETIDAQRAQLELQRKEMARLAEEQKVKEAALEEAKRMRLEGEQAAQRLADEMKALPGATV